MSTLEMRSLPKYGVTEYKKRTLDSLTIQVLNATDQVSQLQAIVTSLTQKSATYQGFLAQADANRTQALSNKNLVDSVVKSALDLKDNSLIALNEVVKSKARAKDVAQNSNSVINKLIYTAEMINKLANLIVRKKAQNQLISDELVSMVTTAGTDANNAVALALVSLKATFVSQETTQETEATTLLEYIQAKDLYNSLTTPTTGEKLCIQELIEQAYNKSINDYLAAQKANTETLNQLNVKTTELNKAQVNLKSLQSGLAAANAAALAS